MNTFDRNKLIAFVLLSLLDASPAWARASSMHEVGSFSSNSETSSSWQRCSSSSATFDGVCSPSGMPFLSIPTCPPCKIFGGPGYSFDVSVDFSASMPPGTTFGEPTILAKNSLTGESYYLPLRPEMFPDLANAWARIWSPGGRASLVGIKAPPGYSPGAVVFDFWLVVLVRGADGTPRAYDFSPLAPQ